MRSLTNYFYLAKGVWPLTYTGQDGYVGGSVTVYHVYSV
jgi:hypothetical protein